MKYLLDTNIFLRVLVKENIKSYKECGKLLQGIKDKKVKAFTSNIILSEVNWVLRSFYKFPKEDEVLALRSIRNLGLPLNDSYNFGLAVDLYEEFNVKYIDCLIASIPEVYEKEWTVVSYDKDFDKIGVKRVEPGGFING